MHIVIIGSGHAGITAAITLRQNSDDVDISMITDDAYPHYPRPSIYKIISGQKPEEILRYPKSWYEKKNIDLFLDNHVKEIDKKKREILTDKNERISYDKIIITTGSEPFIPPIPGILDGPPYCLRNIEDAIAIREKSEECSAATILGGGLLSVELAKTLSDIGIQPTIIDRSSYPLRKQLDLDGGQFFNKMLNKAFKIKFLFNANSQNIKRNGRVININIRDNSKTWNHKCEFLLNATGIRNDNTLAQKTGITIGKYAILTDPFMQTNIKDIFAAGDTVSIETFSGSKFGIIPTAIDQAKIAAINVFGNRVPYTGTVPWTTLKVAGIDLTSMGDITTGLGINEECVLSNFEKGLYRKLFFKENHLRGAILIGTKKNLHKLKTLTIRRASLKDVNEQLNL